MSEELVPPDFIVSPQLFEETFLQASIPNLAQLGLDGKLNTIKNRFTAWRIFLGILPKTGPIGVWIDRISELRGKYAEITEAQRKVKIDHLDPLIFNPLSQVSDNPWNNFHVDNELKQKIRLDVERTFQERPLFLLPEIQEMMTSILFTWSKLNPDISYKQGMNELLGIFIFVGYADVVTDIYDVQPHTRQILSILNSKDYLEADVYWCFARLMDLGISELFNPVVSHQNRQKSKKKDLFTWDAEKTHNDLVNQDKSQEQNVSSILRRCHKVHHQLLQSTDKELFNHIENRKTEPQMYLQRWLRCMLSREFNLADTLELWDAVFASFFLEPEEEFILLDYICVAMIVFVRAFLLQSDQSGILKRLLKFPPVEDVHILVGMAIKFKSRSTTPLRAQPKPEISPLTTSFTQPKKILIANPNVSTSHMGKPAFITLLDEAIQIIQDSISEKNFEQQKQTRAIDLINKVKNLIEQDSNSPSRTLPKNF